MQSNLHNPQQVTNASTHNNNSSTPHNIQTKKQNFDSLKKLISTSQVNQSKETQDPMHIQDSNKRIQTEGNSNQTFNEDSYNSRSIDNDSVQTQKVRSTTPKSNQSSITRLKQPVLSNWNSEAGSLNTKEGLGNYNSNNSIHLYALQRDVSPNTTSNKKNAANPNIKQFSLSPNAKKATGYGKNASPNAKPIKGSSVIEKVVKQNANSPANAPPVLFVNDNRELLSNSDLMMELNSDLPIERDFRNNNLKNRSVTYNFQENKTSVMTSEQLQQEKNILKKIILELEEKRLEKEEEIKQTKARMKEDNLQLSQLQILFEREKEQMFAILETLSNENKLLRMQLGKTQMTFQRYQDSEQDTVSMVNYYVEQIGELKENINIIEEKRQSEIRVLKEQIKQEESLQDEYKSQLKAMNDIINKDSGVRDQINLKKKLTEKYQVELQDMKQKKGQLLRQIQEEQRQVESAKIYQEQETERNQEMIDIQIKQYSQLENEQTNEIQQLKEQAEILREQLNKIKSDRTLGSGDLSEDYANFQRENERLNAEYQQLQANTILDLENEKNEVQLSELKLKETEHQIKEVLAYKKNLLAEKEGIRKQLDKEIRGLTTENERLDREITLMRSESENLKIKNEKFMLHIEKKNEDGEREIQTKKEDNERNKYLLDSLIQSQQDMEKKLKSLQEEVQTLNINQIMIQNQENDQEETVKRLNRELQESQESQKREIQKHEEIIQEQQKLENQQEDLTAKIKSFDISRHIFMGDISSFNEQEIKLNNQLQDLIAKINKKKAQKK